MTVKLPEKYLFNRPAPSNLSVIPNSGEEGDGFEKDEQLLQQQKMDLDKYVIEEFAPFVKAAAVDVEVGGDPQEPGICGLCKKEIPKKGKGKQLELTHCKHLFCKPCSTKALKKRCEEILAIPPANFLAKKNEYAIRCLYEGCNCLLDMEDLQLAIGPEMFEKLQTHIKFCRNSFALSSKCQFCGKTLPRSIAPSAVMTRDFGCASMLMLFHIKCESCNKAYCACCGTSPFHHRDNLCPLFAPLSLFKLLESLSVLGNVVALENEIQDEDEGPVSAPTKVKPGSEAKHKWGAGQGYGGAYGVEGKEEILQKKREAENKDQFLKTILRSIAALIPNPSVLMDQYYVSLVPSSCVVPFLTVYYRNDSFHDLSTRQVQLYFLLFLLLFLLIFLFSFLFCFYLFPIENLNSNFSQKGFL